MDFFYNRFPCYQTFNLPFCRSICRFLDKPLHCIVTAGVDPVVFRLNIRFASDSVTMIQHIPRTIHFRISKLVAIVPSFYLIIMIRCIIILKKAPHFFICKTKIFIKTLICNRQYFQIIKPGKDTLLRNPKTSCQNR